VRQQIGSQVTTYTLDLAAGLTQVLAGGTYTYLYGQGRIAQQSGATSLGLQYFLGDAGRTVRASGSVRQLAGSTGSVALAKSYEPYGETLSSAGSGSTIYSYTGEIQDAYTNFVYLRARYLDPVTGRFSQRDPSRLERNLYLYAGANPINRVDPSGLFSREQIAFSFGKTSFNDVLDDFASTGKGEHWGLLAALLTALPGDSLIGGALEMQAFFPPEITYGGTVHLGFDFNRGITLNNVLLKDNLDAIVDIFEGGGPWWRILEAKYYQLSSFDTTEVYVDGTRASDYPDFRGVSMGFTVPFLSFFDICGVGVGVSHIVDRFGRFYIGGRGGVGCGLPAEIGYFEGYGAVPGVAGRVDYDGLRNVIDGMYCGDVEIGFALGGGGMGCMTFGDGLQVVGAAIYSLGWIGSISIGWTPTLYLGSNSTYGWDYAIQDQYNGIMREDLLSYPEVPFDGCHTYLPLIGR